MLDLILVTAFMMNPLFAPVITSHHALETCVMGISTMETALEILELAAKGQRLVQT
jgi:hypothetical protein